MSKELLQDRAVHKIGRCVLGLHYADPGLLLVILFYDVKENLKGILYFQLGSHHILMHQLHLFTSTTCCLKVFKHRNLSMILP